ncbi:alpha/beta fold hydrolase [Pseudomonas huaxiensis]|uniref:alpha/beta fold hydrolase n=1 Tax=Pseudomonas huaxiensis TaxID=2213017 RepID=UPI000DA6BA9C|nr:alpha/beta hydrolase [Pseudomonas huaxiensis]
MPCESALPLVLIPGFMLDESLWNEVVEHLPFKRKVHRANLLQGHTIAEIAQNIAADAPPRFVLIGFSLGGYVARSLVQQFPDRVAGLVLIATSLRPDTPVQQRLKQTAVKASAQGQFRGLSSVSISQSVNPLRANDNALIGRIREMGQRMGHDVFARQSLLVRNEISSCTIHCPTLIIAGAQDKLRLPEEARELRDAIPGARLEVVEESGHMIPLEQPEKLALLISHWLDSMG